MRRSTSRPLFSNKPPIRLSIYALTASEARLGLLFGVLPLSLLMAIIILIGGVLTDKPDEWQGIAGVLAIFWLLAAAIAYATSIWMIRGQRQRLDRQLGIRLSGQDRVALASWAKTGHKPDSAHLRPVLPGYVDYLEQLVSGRQSVYTPAVRTVLLILYGVNIIINAASLVMEPHQSTVSHVVAVIAFSFVFVLTYATGKRYKWYARLNTRQQHKVAALRKQL